MFKAKTFENFLTQDEVNKLLNFAKSKDDWQDKEGKGFWSNRFLNATKVYKEDRELGLLLYDIKSRMKNTIINNFTDGNEVYADVLQMIRWFPGMEQKPHSDDMKNAGDHFEWFHHRDFGSIIYLNDDYDGGHTYYPNYGIDVVPKSGMLAVHPGDQKHLHGVTKIQNNMRYTISSFWTYDKQFDDDWSIFK